ncbi:MAG: sugar kinase [Lentisphaeria bacterium]|nr:sugar kinase [Lentisphaeria bacterium]
MNHNVVTFGETMLRLSPPDHERLEQATNLRLHIGGSEMNAAVAAARLGLNVRYVTRLTRNALGQLVENRVREHGVDTSEIVWTDSNRIGTYYVEFGAAPRANKVIYDRAYSAISEVRLGEINWQKILSDAQVLHTSGITPALSSSAADVSLEAVRIAKRMGVTVSIDLNYRAWLWTEADACKVMTELVSQADILITTEEDTKRVFGICGESYEDVARELAQRFDLDVVAITLRETPSVWKNRWTAIAYERGTDEVHRAPKFEIEVVDRVGSGDSFAGGFLYGYLTADVAAGVRYGVGASAIKQTHPGDVCLATLEEVEQVLSGGSLRIAR